MILILRENELPILTERHDLKSFKAIIPGGSPSDDLIQRSASIGIFDKTHFWVNCDWLKAQGDHDLIWHDELKLVLAYAESRGWVREGRVRVHLEESPS